MKIEIHYRNAPTVDAMDIADFADKHGLEMVVRERDSSYIHNRFYASFKDTDIKEGCCLIGAFGDGVSPNDAIREYASIISGGLLVIGAFTPARREINVPKLYYTVRAQ